MPISSSVQDGATRGKLPASQEARSICLGRSEPRLPSRLCGKTLLAIGDEPVESESEANVSPAAKPPIGIGKMGIGQYAPKGVYHDGSTLLLYIFTASYFTFLPPSTLHFSPLLLYIFADLYYYTIETIKEKEEETDD